MTKYLESEQLENLCKMMEEMAGMPKEELPYVRQPGEKGMYELNQRKLVQDMAKTNSPYYDP